MESSKKKHSKKKADQVDFKKLFKFRSFSERIASIRINVAHRVGTILESPQDHDTFFKDGLDKWRELNCTLDFVGFHRDISNISNSLAQLLHHKEEVINKLKDRLSIKDTLAYEPLLDLLVQLARDLQGDFYPHFREFFPLLVSMCNTLNSEVIQCVFTTFAYLFKFLWRHMLKDLDNVFRLYSNLLLQSQRPHIRQFAVESFGFILRKVQNLETLFQMIFHYLSSNSDLCDGIGQLLFELSRGVPLQFHSSCRSVLSSVLKMLGCPDLHCDRVFVSVTKMLELMAEHTRREFSEPVWRSLLDHLSLLLARGKGGVDEGGGVSLHRQIGHTLHLIGVMVSWRNGSRISNQKEIFQALHSVLEEPTMSSDTLKIAHHLAASLILVSPDLPDWEDLCVETIKLVCNNKDGAMEEGNEEEEDIKQIIRFFQEISKKQERFKEKYLPYCLQYCEALAKKEESNNTSPFSLILKFLTELCLRLDPRKIDDFCIQVLPSDECVLDLHPLEDRVPTKKTLRGSSHQNRCRGGDGDGGDAVALVSLLAKCLEGNVVLLKRIIEGGHSKGAANSEGREEEEEEETVLSNVWCVLVCFQYVRPIPKRILDELQEIYLFLKEEVLSSSDQTTKMKERCMFLFSQVLSTIVSLIGEGEELSVAVSVESILAILSLFPSSLPLLSSSFHFFSVLSTADAGHALLSSDKLVALLPVLSPSLSSPSSPIRLLTLQILCVFDQLFLEGGVAQADDPPVLVDVLEVCLRAEKTPASLDSYRNKLLWIQRLVCISSNFSLLPEVYREIPLRYLLGVLYTNFNLVWDPVIEVISSYAVEENMALFWKVFGEKLNQTSQVIENLPPDLQFSLSSTYQPPSLDSWQDSLSGLYRYQNQVLSGMECRRPDYACHRMQMWKCLSGLSLGMTEPRSRILVPLLLRFIRNEYSLIENTLKESQDVRKDVESADKEEDGGGGDREEGEEREGGKGEMVKKETSKQDGNLSGKNLTLTLLAMLKLFTKFRNPRSFYRQEEVWGLYMKLLTHKQSDVQILALEGLLSFKPSYLLPYRENFDKLLEDTSFREELVNFRLDAESAVVASQHREDLLPILIRVLYGRMQRQGGHNTTKSGGANRRGLVLRFLGGCEGNELTEFINLLTLPFSSYLEKAGDVAENVASDVAVDMSHVVPLKKQQGFLNMLGQMISTLGTKLLPHLPLLLNIVIYQGKICSQLLDNRDKVQPYLVNALKALRQLAISQITECFEKFLDFDFSGVVDHLFASFVWPQLPRIPQESLQHPIPLLKLLLAWTEHPQYWYLLAKPLPHTDVTMEAASGDQNIAMETDSSSVSMDTTQQQQQRPSVLKYVFDTLSSPKASSKVCGCIMEMSVNLLTLCGEEEGGAPETMATGETGDGSVLSSGENLIAPFVHLFLDYLRRVIGEGFRGRKARNVSGNFLEKEFVILSRISSFVKDPEQSSILIRLVLPFLLNHSEQYKRYEASILHSIKNLIQNASRISQFSRPLSQLFLILRERSSRKSLCEIFQSLTHRDEKWTKTAEVVTKLNAWDSRLLDEPDYDKRLEGFSIAKEMLMPIKGQEETRWSSSIVETTYPVLQNTLFYLLRCPDMSIRDAAASYITKFFDYITIEDIEPFRLFILESILTAVKQGLRSKEAFARHEFITILSDLVQRYRHHPSLSDMFVLKHEDPDADFFTNVKHIQLHRRTRAFQKLGKVCSEGSIGQGNCLNFVLPLANQVVFAPTTNTEHNLVAGAINVIGGVARQLSWKNYSFILSHYLRQLSQSRDHQNNLIRIVVAVLDNFTFDLSSITSEMCDDIHGGGNHDNNMKMPTPDADVGGNKNLVPIKPDEEAGNEEVDEEAGNEEVEEMQDEVEETEDGDEEVEDKMEEETGEGSDGDDETKRRALAKKIYLNIHKTIIPKLQEILTKKVDVPGHKLSQQEPDVDSEVLRVPVAMAMTKLLQALPEEQLHVHLPSLLLKVCLTLKHRSRDVRDVGRNTLVKMARSLGPKYLNFIIKEMKDSLDRGYMLHVLSYSLHHLLHVMSQTPHSSATSSSSPPLLGEGDLDSCLETVSAILVRDLFGLPAEERESGENVAKIPESKTPQSYNSYEIVASLLSPKLLPDLLSPVKEVLKTRCNSRNSRVVEEVFRRVGLGIQTNHAFTPQALLVFIHGIVSDSIPQLGSKPKPIRAPTSNAKSRPPDSRLLPPKPERSGPRPVTMGNVGANIITEFGLQLLHVALKRGKFDASEMEQLQMLDPFVPLLVGSFSSPHVKVLSRTLHCLIWVVRMPLPSLEGHIDTICTHVFGLLRRYARAGMGGGNNRELVLSSFKAMTVIVRDYKKHDITEDELRILLGFVEEDIHDYQRQSTALPLLKAILSRKLVVVEIYDTMHKVATLSLTSDSEHVRLQCRQALLQFLMDYPLGKKLNRYLDFFITNLSYDKQSGRESILEQLDSIFTKFPVRMLSRNSTYFFIPLSVQLLNEESPICRQMVAAAIKSLLSRLDTIRINEVAVVMETWIKDTEFLHKRIGMQTLGILVDIEKQSFVKRLSVFIPLIHQCLLLEGFQKEEPNEEEKGAASEDDGEGGVVIESSSQDKQASEENRVRVSDYLLFNTLATLSKICQECSDIFQPSFSLSMSKIWECVSSLLLHPHAWVRLSSARLFGLYFSVYSLDEFISKATATTGGGCDQDGRKKRKSRRSALEPKEEHVQYIFQNGIEKVQELCSVSCQQLNSVLLNAELANQVIKNLVFLAKVLHRLEIDGMLGEKEEDEALIPQEEETEEGEEPLDSENMDKVRAFKQRSMLSDLAEGGDEMEEEEEEGRKRNRGTGHMRKRRRTRDLRWLIDRMSRLARYEAGHRPKEAIKRTHVLQWTAAVSMDLGSAHLPSLLPALLPPLRRELSDTNQTAGKELHLLAQEVVEILKQVCDDREAFSRAFAQVQKSVVATRERRMRHAVMEAVVNPERHLLRKRRKNELKKESKKRKIFMLRPDGTAAAKASRKRH